ncbi:hypothetical protein DRN69_01205 [Candidatus Pacearchaeota archaeon]|nr:MAG: hypothetical protein DRN69_01205 [Candidatus Pacearchaeota archaeon]
MLEIFYVNKCGKASLDLRKVLETCPFRNYCGEFYIKDRKVCDGEKGDYTNCGIWLYYMEQDTERPRAKRKDF